jgi:tRNA pseudouridine55 synthase
MARVRKGLQVNGWLILDKPQGLNSTKAVSRVKHLFNAQKAGHAGTLDPLATGVLPIALGEATKTVPFVMDGSKAYRFTIVWGAETDTDDSDGSVTEQSEKRPSRSEIEAILPRFTGTISQLPPRYSALKVDGARAYDLARENEDFELQPRDITIDSLRLVEISDPEHAVLEAECGKGTYVRSLARDIGRVLGALGHVGALRRTRVGPFDEAEAISLATLETLEADGLPGTLLPVETALTEIPSLSLSSSDAARLRLGQSVLLRGRDAPIISGPIYAVSKGALIAIGEVSQGEFKPKRIFNLSR